MQDVIYRWVVINRAGVQVGPEYPDRGMAWHVANKRNQRLDMRTYRLVEQKVDVDMSDRGPEMIKVVEVSTGAGGVRKEREYFRPVDAASPVPANSILHIYTDHNGDVHELVGGHSDT